MGGAFLGAMDMKISQSDTFFDALSSQQVKMRLHRVKMMTYNEKSTKKKKNRSFDFSFFSLMSLGMLNFKFGEFSGLKVINYHFRRNSTF